jgi:hypothetical protein
MFALREGNCANANMTTHLTQRGDPHLTLLGVAEQSQRGASNDAPGPAGTSDPQFGILPCGRISAEDHTCQGRMRWMESIWKRPLTAVRLALASYGLLSGQLHSSHAESRVCVVAAWTKF